MKNATMQVALIKALTEQTQSEFSEDQIRQLAAEIALGIEHHDELQSLPDAIVRDSIQPTIQVVLAQGHASVADAAQYAIQVLVTQVSEDPHIGIPTQYQDADDCPYPGLSAFSEDDKDLFYGREHEIAQFVDRLPCRLIAITGASGVGKSSFIQAGVVPQLRVSFGDNATIILFRASTSGDFLSEFATLLSRVLRGKDNEVRHALESKDDALFELLQPVSAKPGHRVFLLIDQFEEIFVHETTTGHRRRFLDNLLFVSTTPQLHSVSIILISRKNFFEHRDYIARPQLVETLEKASVNLDTLTDTQLRQAIERPLAVFNLAHQQSLHFQNGLVDVIVRDFHNLTSSLPLVQYLLRLMWVEKHHLSHFAYVAMGKLDRVLDRHATDIYAGFADDLKPRVDRILLALVGLGLEGEHTRKRVRYDQIIADTADELVVRRLSAPSSRIISEQMVGGIEYIELTHEVILREWSILSSLIAVNRERLKQREQLLVNAELWFSTRTSVRPGGDPGYLYQGTMYRQAQQYIGGEKNGYSTDNRIIECFRISQRRRRQTAFALFAVFAFAILIAAGVFGSLQQRLSTERQRANINATAQSIAEEQALINENARATAAAQAKAEQAEKEQQATLALSRRLANKATDILESFDIARAALLAVESVKQFQSPSNVSILRKIAAQLPDSIRKIRHEATVLMTACNTECTISVSFDSDGNFLVWETVSGRILLKEHQQGISNAVFSPIGTLLVTASNMPGTNGVRVWNYLTGELVKSFNLPDKTGVNKRSIAFNSDASLLAIETLADVESHLPEVTVFETQDWNLYGHFFPKMSGFTSGGVSSIHFSPADEYLIVGATGLSGIQILVWNLITQSLELYSGFEGGGEGLTVTFNNKDDAVAIEAAGEVDVLSLPSLSPIDSLRGTEITNVLFEDSGSLIGITRDGISRSGESVFITGTGDEISAVSQSSDGRYLALGTSTAVGFVLDTNDYSLVHKVQYEGIIDDVRCNHDESCIAVGRNQNTAWSFRIKSPYFSTSIPTQDSIVSLEFSPDGQSLAAGSYGDVFVFSVHNPQKFERLSHGRRVFLTYKGIDELNPIDFLRFSADGTALATESWRDGVKIWDTSTWALRSTVSALDQVGQGTGVIFPDEDLFTYQDSNVQSLSNADEAFPVKSNDIFPSTLFSRDYSKFILATYEPRQSSHLAVWDTSTYTQIFDIVDINFGHINASDNGNVVAYFSHDYSSPSDYRYFVRVWNVISRTKLYDVEVGNWVSLDLSSDGKYIALGESNGRFRVVDTQTGTEKLDTVAGAEINVVKFSQDGRWVAYGTEDGRVEAFEWDAQDMIDYVCNSLLTRTLTKDDLTEFPPSKQPSQTCR